ncbi:MAG TPA: hypothetical protein VFK45_04745, partial [Gammaproteobacteria bacterium]|nr:hypothetical protein [Gammaproteobacteria bacterium]
MNRRAFAGWAIWLVSLGLLCGFAWTQLDPAAPIQTNILALLPEQHDSPALDIATERSRDEFTHRLLALVRGPDNAETRAAAMAARKALLDAGLRAESAGAAVDAALAVYEQHHFALLTAAQAARLENEGPRA